eukprot:g8435.t1
MSLYNLLKYYFAIIALFMWHNTGAVRRLKRKHLKSMIGKQVQIIGSNYDRKLGVTKAGLLGDVALTVVSGFATQQNGADVGTKGNVRNVGENIFGPFEAGFGTAQDDVIRDQLGCTKSATLCYSEGGTDVTIAEKICAYNCNISLPRLENGKYYGFLDNCGGHTKDYHYHKDLSCLYTSSAGSKHSIKVAEVSATSKQGGGQQGGGQQGGGQQGGGGSGSKCSDGSTPKCPDGSALKNTGGKPCTGGKPVCADGSNPPPPRRLAEGQGVYGKWEDYSKSLLPSLDACNGHWGRTAESPDKDVYHYHITAHPPFTIGCYGPNDDNSPVTVQQCRDVYDECSETAALELYTVKDKNGVTKIVPYQPWCPCWDKSGAGPDGQGLNVGNVKSTRKWVKRKYVNGAYTDDSTGTFAGLSEYASGIAIVDINLTSMSFPLKIDTAETSSGLSTAASSETIVVTTAILLIMNVFV